MKKTLSIIMLVAVLVSSFMVFPVSAENYDEVYKGTPTFDGKLDNLYLSSLSSVMNESNWSGLDYKVAKNGSELKGDYYDPNFTATSYFLHDDDYFYVCVYVKDANIIDAPASTKDMDEPWPIDGVELFVDLSHSEIVSFRTDAFNTVKKTKPIGYEDYFEYKAVRGNGYYTIEYRIEKVGLNIAKKNGALKVCVQIDDLYSLDYNKPLGIGAGFDLGSTDTVTMIYLKNKKATGGTDTTPDTTTKTPVVTPAETTKAPVVTPEETTKAPVVVPGDDTTIKDDTPVVVPGDDTTVEGDDTTVPDDTTVEGDETIADDTTAAPDDDTTEAEGDDVEDTTKAPDTTKDDDTKEEDPSFPVVPVVIIAVVVVAAVVAGIIIAKKRK